MTFYHGSPVKGLKHLKPRLDPRLNLKGVFVADEPFGPMMFSLLPDRAHSMVKYETKKGKFIKGKKINNYEILDSVPVNSTSQPNDGNWYEEGYFQNFFFN